MQPAVVTIDGPAGSGKSTVGNLLAQKINFLFFDTGILYRAVTLAAIENTIELGDQVGLSRLAEGVKIDLYPPAAHESDGRILTVMLDGIDVTWQIRTPEVEHNVSPVSAVVGVRKALTEQQRRIGHYYGTGRAEKPGIVMVGRDIGTIVMPEAPVKIYLEALPTERARRRCDELRARGKETDYALVLADIQRRDQIDSSRTVAPLRPAEDALTIDTTELSPNEVVDRILQAIVA
ncbi:MAG: (d)CMP kinase [Caldilineaceae bacterium]